MSPDTLALLTGGVFAVAFLYASVGHAGASGYIAVMTLVGLAPVVIKPAALTLNILVALIGSWQFWRAGHFSWRLFWPFSLISVPCAYWGGRIALPADSFKLLLGLILLYSALHLLLRPPGDGGDRGPPKVAALGAGGGIGLLSGLTGTGGGIFLTPLLLFMRWAPAKTAAAVSALFILLNSTAALLGHWQSTGSFPEFAYGLLLAAGVGGSLGSYFGSRRFDPQLIKRLLAVVLMIAGTKLLLTQSFNEPPSAAGPAAAGPQ